MPGGVRSAFLIFCVVPPLEFISLYFSTIFFFTFICVHHPITASRAATPSLRALSWLSHSMSLWRGSTPYAGIIHERYVPFFLSFSASTRNVKRPRTSNLLFSVSHAAPMSFLRPAYTYVQASHAAHAVHAVTALHPRFHVSMQAYKFVGQVDSGDAPREGFRCKT